MRKAALFYENSPADGIVYDERQRNRIAALTDLYPEVVNGRTFDQHAPALRDLEVIFATWGMPRFEERHFEALPRLEAVFYAAGNVRAFAGPLVERGITLVSAWDVNAIPVAEMCLAQILLSLRGYYRSVRGYRERKALSAKQFWRPGVQDETIGLIGLGKIGTRLRKRLRDYPLTVIAHDPFLTEAGARDLEVEPVGLDEVFERALIVSNHIPDLATTRGLIGEGQLGAMREGATFINSGRGAQVVEADLVRVMRARPDLTALLDVTWPEPPAADSPLWTLPNVVISPHIGGTIGHEVTRLSDCIIEEFEAWQAGRPLRYQVTPAVLETMG